MPGRINSYLARECLLRDRSIIIPISLTEQSGITHGSTEHQFIGTVTVKMDIPAENVGTETLPSAIVIIYIIKT